MKSARKPRRITRAKANAGDDRAAIVRRMWGAADAQVRAIERRLKQDADAPDERDARVLAVLSRTLRELVALDEVQAAPRTNDKPDHGLDDGEPLDLDELRRELESRLAGLRERSPGPGDRGASA